MNILIVGGFGYLGPIIAKILRETHNNLKIDVVDNFWFEESYLENGKLYFDSLIRSDKRDLTATFLKNYQIVIDLAAVSNDPMGKDFESATMEINTKATLRIANLCKSNGVEKFVFASSCSIYGAAGDKAKQEDDKKGPLTAYARSKWESEKKLEMLADSNFTIFSLRFATACGWSPHFRADLVLNDFVVTALTEKKILVLSDGTPWRPLIHVNDIGLAVSWSCGSQLKGYNYFNVGSNKWTLTVKDLASTVGNIMGVPVEIVNSSGDDKRSYRVSFDKFNKAAKKWLPSEDVSSTVEEISINAGRDLSKLTKFREGSLIRLNFLRHLISMGKLDYSLRWQSEKKGTN